MKRLILSCLVLSLILSSCQENMPTIPVLGPPDTGSRKVLIEEFTGVRCVNCPQGSAEIENLLGLYGGNLIAVSIHAGTFSPPYGDSQYDFRTEAGTELLTFLGEPLGYPSAVINRKKFQGQFGIQSNQQSWAGFIESEIAEEPRMGISINVTYDENNRETKVQITLIANEPINEDLRLSVMLTESNIVDQQETPEGKKADYVHKHVLRDLLSNNTGDNLGNSFVLGEVIEKNYTYTLPENYKAENCNVVVFVNLAGDDKNVLQVDEAHIVE
jgi:hypothetical protein